MSDQSPPQTTPSKPQLANSTLWLMAMICGLCAGGNYFNQPLLHSIQNHFQVDAAMAQLTVTCAQVSYAVGLLFLEPLGDLLKRQYLIPTLMVLTAIGLMISAFAQNIYNKCKITYSYWVNSLRPILSVASRIPCLPCKYNVILLPRSTTVWWNAKLFQDTT